MKTRTAGGGRWPPPEPWLLRARSMWELGLGSHALDSVFQPERETESVHGKGDGPLSPRTTGAAGQASGPQGVALARGEAVAGTARGGVLLQGSDQLQTVSFFQSEVELQVAKPATPVLPMRD